MHLRPLHQRIREKEYAPHTTYAAVATNNANIATFSATFPATLF